MIRDEEPKTTGYVTTKRRDEYTNTGGGIMPDPLVTVGFINIRIRPPLHSRGIRRMTFPAEVTVTICSPVNTNSQLADYTTLCEHFSSMDSHYITASVEMPLASKLAKEIIVRATRNEFVAKYGLVSLRWDENIQRRDSANGNYQDGSVDETITDSCSNSLQDECKKGDLQMGVAKLWATRPEVMRNALDRLCKSDGVIISVSMGDDIRREAINSDNKALIQTSLAEILPLSSSVGKYRLSSPNRLSATSLSPGRQSHEPRNSGERIFIHNENDVSNHLGSSPSDSPTKNEDALSKKSLRPIPPGFDTSSISPAKSTKDLFDFDCDDSGCSSSHSTSESFDDVTVSSKIKRVQYNEDEVVSHAKDVDDSKNFRDRVQSNFAIPSIDFYRSFNQEVKPTLQPLGVKIAMPKFHDIDHLTCLLTSTQPQEKTAAETSVEDKLTSNSFWSEHTSLPRNSEKSPFAIAAAPGLTIPTDWDFILEKAGLSSSIPSALSLPYPSKKLHPQTIKEGNSSKNDAEQLLASSQYTSTESYLTTGFLTTFPFGAAHTPRGAGIDGHLQDDLLGDPSTLFPTRSHRDTDGRSFSFDSSSNQCSYGRNDLGPSIVNDSISLGRRKSLDLGDIATGVARQIRPYDQHGESRQYMLPQFDVETNTLSNHYSHYQLTLSRQQQLISNVTDNRFVVHWPHPSLRFMFLVDPLKYQLSDLLHKFRARGVDVSTPFRDKSSPSACLVIDGD